MQDTDAGCFNPLAQGAGPCWARWSRGAGSAHLPLLQQAAQGALADDVASAQVQADAQAHHHQAQEPSNNTRCNRWDLGAATQQGTQKEKKIIRC